MHTGHTEDVPHDSFLILSGYVFIVFLSVSSGFISTGSLFDAMTTADIHLYFWSIRLSMTMNYIIYYIKDVKIVLDAKTVKEYAKRLGADIVGIASMEIGRQSLPGK